jgi:predicted membrane-bound spermidine synthase
MPDQPNRALKTPIILVSILFFLSGSAGLIYEIVWERLLEVYFGVTLTAITLIVAAYMGGLGLGSLLGGRIASRSRRPVLLYGIIEVGIGLFGLVSPTLIHWIGRQTAGSPYTLVFILSFALLLIPTVLMGTTLPLLTQTLVRRIETTGRTIGLLYGINTLGAAFGALLAAYVLIGWGGFFGAILFGVALNLVAGVGALAFSWSPQASNAVQVPDPQGTTAASPPIGMNYSAILLAAFLVGFIDMGIEMVWFRVLGILNKHSAYGFPSVLAVFLTGLAIGGFLWGQKADKSKDPIILFWKLQIGMGITLAASFLIAWVIFQLPTAETWVRNNLTSPQLPASPYVRIGKEFVFSKRVMLLGLLDYFVPILLLVLPASLFMGGGLPVLDRIAIRSAEQSGRRVGDIHLSNIMGSVLGTLAPNYVLLPLLGSELTLKLFIILALSFTLLVWSRIASIEKTIRIGMPVLMVILGLLLPWRGQLFTRWFEIGTGKRTMIDESGDSLLSLTFHDNSDLPTQLWIGGIQNSYFPTNGDYERTAMVCASASQPKRILLIGLGGGNTAYFLTKLPAVEEVIIVELMEDLGSFLDEYAPVAQRVFDDPRVQYVIDDGRRYMYANPDEKYDMIFIDPLYSFTAGHNNLYSLEAMRLYRSQLTDNGIFCGWKNEAHVIPLTAATVFPHMIKFPDVIVAGMQDFDFNLQYLQQTFDTYMTSDRSIVGPGTRETLNPDNILKRRSVSRETLLEREGDSPILTDMNPWLEYYYLHEPIR